MLQDLLSKYATEAEKQTYLQQLVKEHPYFTPAHFCLLQSTPVAEAVYAQRAATTALLFNNAGWLNYQLHNKFKETTAVATPEAVLPTAEQVTEQQNEVAAPAIETIPEETIIPATASHETILPVDESTAELKNEVIITGAIQSEPVIATPETEEIQAAISHAITNDIEVSAETEKVAGSLPIPGPGKHDSELLFEPLYAVDYFASQGIKLSEDLQSGDKLGKQLKSFTEWLKSMKKTQAQATEEQALPASNPAIQNIAEKSNIEGEVVTEAMAIVYAQQGNIKKAIGIYQKLSLLNPPKSAYFAAKIENLK
jgi:tetratricopeptide (TPR) repeat protein